MKKLLIVLLCVAMFCAGCAVTGLSWRGDVSEMKEAYAAKIEELEQTVANMNTQILDLTAEMTLHEMNMKKLKILYGIDVEELLGDW